MSPAAPPAWLSIGPASRLLGVDPDTLRRWADTGRVRAFATPGGHRRFNRADLDRVAAARRPGSRPLAALGATPTRVTRACARAYRRAAPDRLRGGLASDDRERFRSDGRRLVAVLLACLDASKAADRQRWELEALELIGGASRRLAAAGTELPDVLAVYLQARRPILGELAAIGRRRALDATQLAELYERAVDLLDRLLLHLIETSTAARRGTA